MKKINHDQRQVIQEAHLAFIQARYKWAEIQLPEYDLKYLKYILY